MTRKELIKRLEDEHDVKLKASRLEYLIWEGHLPAPEVDISRRRNYQEVHYETILALLGMSKARKKTG